MKKTTHKVKPDKLQEALRTNLKRRKAAPKPGLHKNYVPMGKDGKD